MKYILIAISLVGVMVTLIFFSNMGGTNEEYLRIHIRANSNMEIDQNVKYEVKDKVVDALIPVLSEIKTKEEAQIKIGENLGLIERTANNELAARGFRYVAKARLAHEEFPTRSYGELTLEGGFYDALILELGEGKGDNWWCVVYPPFCFVSSSNSTNYEYISKLWDIIKNVLK